MIDLVQFVKQTVIVIVIVDSNYKKSYDTICSCEATNCNIIIINITKNKIVPSLKVIIAEVVASLLKLISVIIITSAS